MIVTSPPPIVHPDPRPGTHLFEDAFGYVYWLHSHGHKWLCVVPQHGKRHCERVK